MDLDDLDEPTQAPAKASRFAPKSKFQPKSKQSKSQSEPSKREPPPAQDAAPSTPVVVKKEDEVQSAMDATVLPKLEEETREGLARNGDSMEANATVEEEDYVVAEYTIFSNHSDADTKLYVLQYPLRQSWRPYELDQRCTEVRVRPKSAEVELDLSIDRDSDNFDPGAPSAAKMMKQTLSCQFGPHQSTAYGVGVLKDKKLYMNPLHAVVQLRTSMEYLDSSSKKKNIPETTVKAEGSVGQSRKQSKQMDAEAVESWIPLKYHSPASELSEKYLRRMMVEEPNSLQFPMKPCDYLDSICPPAAVNKTKLKGPSRSSLLSLPLEERLKTWLIEGPPIQRFSAIKHLAPDDSDEEILEVLQKWANLIQGLWVAKPAVRYPNAAGPEALARDYVLLLFSQSPVIKDSELDVLGSRKSFGKAVLREIADERTSCKDWKFKESRDVSFIKLYPDVVNQQAKQWEDREKQILGKFPQLRNKTATRPDNGVKSGSTIVSNEGAVKATNRARSSKMSMSKETQEALLKVLRKFFQTHKVCSFQMICQGLRDMAVSMSTLPKADARAAVAAALSVDASQEELQAAVSEVAEYVNGVYVLKSSMDHPEFNPLRSVVIELFRGTPNAKLKKSEIIEAAKIKLQREPTNNEFQKVITEYCVSKGGAWVLKSGDGVPK